VLGASGFIGSALSRALATRPIGLRLVARRPAPVPRHAVADVEVCATDLTAPGALAAAVADCDAVVHLVAYTDGGWRVADGDTVAERVNVGLVEDLVAALRSHRAAPATVDSRRAVPAAVAAGVAAPAAPVSVCAPPAVLFAGTDTQVGLTDHERIDGTEPDRPRSAYCRQKLAAENVLKQATADGLIRAASLRLPTVYGHGPDSTCADRGVVSLMVRRALAGDPLTMWHDGTVRRDLVYIDDVTAAFVAALDHMDALAGRHWLIGSGMGVPLGVVFAQIADLVSGRTGRAPVEVVSVDPPAHAEPTDLKSVEIDSSAFRAVTGWRPWVSLRDGLTRTVTALAPSGR
jgi:nucleoside-diphosphate-sugar epimerase